MPVGVITQRPPGIPEGKKPIKFEDFSFSDITWEEKPKSPHSPDLIERKSQVKILVEGKEYTVDLEFNDFFVFSKPEVLSHTSMKFRILDSEGDRLLSGRVKFFFYKPVHDSNEISEELYKNDTNKKLPKEFGREVYKKMLDFMQHQVSEYRTSFTHIVTRDARNPSALPQEKWDSVFTPILIDRGYTRHKFPEDDLALEDDWRKEYKP